MYVCMRGVVVFVLFAFVVGWGGDWVKGDRRVFFLFRYLVIINMYWTLRKVTYVFSDVFVYAPALKYKFSYVFVYAPALKYKVLSVCLDAPLR